MPKNTKVARCVRKVKAKNREKGGKVNPYTVCQESTGQNYATGKKRKKTKKGRRG